GAAASPATYSLGDAASWLQQPSPESLPGPVEQALANGGKMISLHYGRTPLRHYGEAALHYGRSGKMIVLGPYAQRVEQALANGAKERGWLSDEKVAQRLGKLDDTIAVAVARPFTLLGGVMWSRPVAVEKQEGVRPSERGPRTSPPEKEPSPPPPARR